MKKPVICQVSDFGPEYPGSFVDSLLCLAHHCRRTLQMETICIFPDRARNRKWLTRFDTEGVRCAFVPAKRNVVLSLRRAIADTRPLIFHSHFETFDIGVMLLKMMLYRESKIVWHFHSIAELTLQQRIKDAIKVKLLANNFGDLFIPVADGVYRNAIDRGFSKDRLFLHHNGIDIARFSNAPKARQDARAALRVSNDQTVFLVLGYNPVIKGVDLFVKAIGEMSRKCSVNSLFLIIGRETTKDFVRKMPEYSGLQTAIRMLDPTDDFPRLLSAIDILVAPSRTEGFSYAVLEAMASGKMVLCSDIPGVRENYGNVQGVWLFPPNDWKKLAELMQGARELSPAQMDHLAQTNAQYVTNHYSLEEWAMKTSAMYSRVLNGGFRKD